MSFLRRRMSYGKPVLVYLASINNTAQDFNFVFASSRVVFNSNGLCQVFSETNQFGTLLSDSFTWLLKGNGSDYDIRLTNGSGDALTAGSINFNQKYSLSTARQFLVSTSSSSVSNTFTIQLLSNSSGTVLTSNTATLTATVIGL